MAFIDLPGPVGRLEALYSKVERPVAAALLCHPHPLHGGTLHTHVIYHLAQAFQEARCSVLRFNFRGVGRSSGVHDQGRGEVEDAKAALDFLESQEPGVPLVCAGFSFGAKVGLQLAVREARVKKAMGVGLAISLYEFGFLQQLGRPLALIQGDRDQFGTVAQVEALVETLPKPVKLFVVPDCDHLATGRLEAFGATARLAVDWLLEAPAQK